VTLSLSLPPGVEGGIGDGGEVWFRGVGIHTGEIATVSVSLDSGPAAAGVRFVTSGGVAIPALSTHVVDTARCTVLGTGDGVMVSTVEHLLSAFHGLGIGSGVITIDGPEVPILDGSAALWVDALRSAVVASAAPSQQRTIAKPIVVSRKGGSFLAAYPSDRTRITLAVSFDHPLVGTQVVCFEPASGRYALDVAPARTFGFIEEVEALRAAGLARGGSFENAVVIYRDRMSTPLRSPSELAYHKLLDVLGDLFLAFGGPLPYAIDLVAVKPSHRLNVELAAHLAQVAAADAVPTYS